MEEWQASIIQMGKDITLIRLSLDKEIKFKNTLIYILLGVSFGITVVTKYGGA